jgi:DUF177 domain-containing protein
MGKTTIKDFEIPIFGRRQGVIESSFEIDSEFFELFENSLVEKGKLRVRVQIEKGETLIKTNFEIKGDVELSCDRSLEEFDHKIEIKREHVFKYSDHEEDYSEEITLIPFETTVLNLAQLVYEYIGLEIPFRKLHPRFLNEDGSEKEFFIENRGQEKEKIEIDPRWEELKKIRKK